MFSRQTQHKYVVRNSYVVGTFSGDPSPSVLVTYVSPIFSRLRRPFLDLFPESVMGSLKTLTYKIKLELNKAKVYTLVLKNKLRITSRSMQTLGHLRQVSFICFLFLMTKLLQSIQRINSK